MSGAHFESHKKIPVSVQIFCPCGLFVCFDMIILLKLYLIYIYLKKKKVGEAF